MSHTFIHHSADVAPSAVIGRGTRVWHLCHVRENAVIGENCILARGVYIDAGVHIGSNVKIQNYVSVYLGVTIEDGVFVGPHVCFTNDLQPRAINLDGTLKSADDWTLSPTIIHTGASIGANSTIVCGIEIGQWAMVGAGSTVTRTVPAHGFVYGTPARLVGYVCYCGKKLQAQDERDVYHCVACGETIHIGST